MYFLATAKAINIIIEKYMIAKPCYRITRPYYTAPIPKTMATGANLLKKGVVDMSRA